MTDVTARYIIAADDRTRAAIQSARAGFTSLEGGVKGVVSRLNVAFGILTGAGLKRTLQNVFSETAKQNRDFASALDDVRTSARNLLSAHDGAPAAAASLRELSAILKDPKVVEAADAITSAFIGGFSKAAAVIASLGKLFGPIESGLDAIGSAYDRLPQGMKDALRLAAQGNPIAVGLRGIDQLTAPSGHLSGRSGILERRQLDAFVNAREGQPLPGRRYTAGEAAQVRREFRQLSEEFDQMIADEDRWRQMQRETSDEIGELYARSADERIEQELEFREEMGWTWHQRLEAEREVAQVRKELNRQGLDNFLADWRTAFDAWLGMGQRTARSFLQALLAALGNRQLMKLLDMIFGGGRGGSGSGFLSSVFSAIGGIFTGNRGGTVTPKGPLAAGGSFSKGDYRMVGEGGKAEMALFGKSGYMLPAGSLGRGGVHISIDARGSTMDSAIYLERRLKKFGEELNARFITGINTGRTPISPP